MKHLHLTTVIATLSLSVAPLAVAPATAQTATKTQSDAQTATQSGSSSTGAGSVPQSDQSASGSSAPVTYCSPGASGCPRSKAATPPASGEEGDAQESASQQTGEGSGSGKLPADMKKKPEPRDASGGTTTEQKSESSGGDTTAGSRNGAAQGSDTSGTSVQNDPSKQSADENSSTNKNSSETKVNNNTTTSNSATNTKANVNVTVQQRTEIRQVIQEVQVAPVKEVDFSVSVGTAIPKRVHLERLPPRIVKIVPAYAGYRFFLLADGRIVIVDPDALTIVYIIEA